MKNLKPEKLILIVLLTFVFFSPFSYAATPKNLGLIPSTTIWYSQDPFYTGDRIRIYTAVYNNSQYDLTGTVEFFDNKSLIGKSEFSLAKGGGLRDVWTDWTVTKGSHRISAKISNAKISLPGQEAQDMAFEESTQESSIVVEDPPKSVVVEEKLQQETQEEKSFVLPESISGIIPPGLTAQASSVIGTIDSFREQESVKLEEKKQEIKEEIAQMEASPEEAKGQTFNILGQEINAEKSLKYLYLAAISGAAFILNNKVLFYILMVLVCLRMLQFLFSKATGR